MGRWEMDMALDTRELFARLIQCEAGGEGTAGMQAVATVIMNRATTTVGEFARVNNGGDVRAIITQPGQFVCMRETVGGRYNAQNVYNMTPTQEHYDIVDWALDGGRLAGVDESLFFFNPYRTIRRYLKQEGFYGTMQQCHHTKDDPQRSGTDRR